MTARAGAENANKAPARANRTAGNRRREGDRLIKLRVVRVAVLRGVGRCIGSFFLFSRSVNRGNCKPAKRQGLPGENNRWLDSGYSVRRMCVHVCRCPAHLLKMRDYLCPTDPQQRAITAALLLVSLPAKSAHKRHENQHDQQSD